MKPKVVLDTNIFISAILFKGEPGKIIDLAITETIEVYISDSILKEIEQVLIKKFNLSPLIVRTIIDEIKDYAVVVRPKIKLNIIKADPPDNRVLECALEAKADFIVSGDKKHLLSLKKFKKIPLLSATQFLKNYYQKQ